MSWYRPYHYLLLQGEKLMNIALWVVQVLLALAFLAAGAMKASQPVENLKKNMGWVHAN